MNGGNKKTVKLTQAQALNFGSVARRANVSEIIDVDIDSKTATYKAEDAGQIRHVINIVASDMERVPEPSAVLQARKNSEVRSLRAMSKKIK